MSIESRTDGPVTTITLNRPDKLNAFSGSMREDLLAALRSQEKSPSCRVVVITGAGRAFCAGGDVAYMSRLHAAGDVDSFRRLLDAGRDVILQVMTMSRPVIASINGVAAGAGCNLALACDFRIASDRATLSESFVRIGLHPDWGGTWLLPRLIGRSRALEILATGRMIEGDEALAIGMIDRLVSSGELETATAELAQRFAAAPPVALAGIKRALAMSEQNDLRAQLELETEHQIRCFQSADAAEGLSAFLERRAPSFQGR
jgi:2-(1,2-epoxy-1,2-dihydrophenyl)acetyl-CoA isomerase